MKRSQTSGFTLLEVMTVVAIIAILVTLSVMALNALPGRARMSGGVMELNATLAAARSHSLGRGMRVAVLINTAEGPPGAARVRYWMVLDPWQVLDDAMESTPAWGTPEALVPPAPAPAGESFEVLDSARLADSIHLASGGFKSLVSPPVHPGCTAAGAPQIELLSGPTAGGQSFPPPFCGVPDDEACTFCTADGPGRMRGAIFFEPDGRVVLVDAGGTLATAGAGSIVFTRSSESTPNPDDDPRALVLLETGLVRSFDQTR